MPGTVIANVKSTNESGTNSVSDLSESSDFTDVDLTREFGSVDDRTCVAINLTRTIFVPASNAANTNPFALSPAVMGRRWNAKD